MAAVRTVAIDLGAGSGRVVAVSYDRCGLSLQEVHRFPTPTLQDAETGYKCWDLDEIESQIRKGLEAAYQAGPLQSLGIDGWGVDFVLLDGEQRRVGPAVSYLDGRTRGILDGLSERLAPAEIYRRTGIQFMPINTLCQLAQTAQAHPDWLARARTFLMLPDYLHFRLCGVLVNEYTNATTTQMYRLAADGWDPGLVALAGLRGMRMLHPVEPGTVLAEIGAGSRPLERVMVIAPATHDTASAVAAIPFEGEDEAFISSGSWSLVGFESRVPCADLRAQALNFSNEGGVDRRYRVLKNLVGLRQAQRLAQELGIGHQDLVDAASRAVPWRSLIPPDDTRFLDPPFMVEAIQQFCRSTGQPVPEGAGALARCVFESLALAYREAVEQIEGLRGRPVTGVRIVGGGSRNALLDQLCADACQVPVKAGPVETSVLGNACVQLMALGVVGSLAEARELVARSQPMDAYRPGPAVPAEALDRFEGLSAQGAGKRDGR